MSRPVESVAHKNAIPGPKPRQRLGLRQSPAAVESASGLGHSTTLARLRAGKELNLEPPGDVAYTAPVLESLIHSLGQSQHLTAEQVGEAVAALVDGNVSPKTKAEFLTALAHKGETPEEVAAFARELRDRALQPVLDPETRGRVILDVVGTGGDRLGTFNISTASALVAASGGVTVAKHGNRAVTSQTGSADVLDALGIRIDLTPGEAAASLRDHGFAFFFAPAYHPAFKQIGAARKLCAEQGQRTIFNFLGPLLNPVRPNAQLMGVPAPKLCESMACVLQSLGVRRGMVVSGRVGSAGGNVPPSPSGTAPASGGADVPCIDELSTLGETTVAEFYQEHGLTVSTLRPEDFPIRPAALQDLAGTDRMGNAEIIRRILAGVERGPKRDAVLLNTAAALWVAGVVGSLTEGWDRAAELIDSGRAQAKLTALIAST